MLQDLTVKTPYRDTRTCCICGGVGDGVLGLLQYAGRAVMEAHCTANPWAHEKCIPTHLRHPRQFHSAPDALSGN